MQSQNQSFNRQPAESGRSNVKQFPTPEPISSNPFDQVNKFDLAQWNQIVADISRPEVAKAVILVMDQRDSLKALFPSVYVRAHQTCIAAERKAQNRIKRIATARRIGAGAFAMLRIALVRAVAAYVAASAAKSGQRRVF
jgi:hypothetical protein